jgi:hypothetical protein
MTTNSKAAQVSQSTYHCEVDFGWRFDFVALDAHVRTVHPDSENPNQVENSKIPLTIEINSQIDSELDSALEAARYSRPTLLTLQGVISFITGKPLTIFDFPKASHTKLETYPVTQPVKVLSCEINGVNRVDSLTELLKILDLRDDKADLLASALDRWRRATYLSHDFTDEDVSEEVFLGFFHVLELLADEEYNTTKQTVQERIKNFCTDIYMDEFKKSGAGLTNSAKKLADTIETLINDDISVTTKITRLISKYELYSPRLRDFVASLVEVRNAIAHGRYVFQPKLLWSLPAFFPLHEKTNYLLPAIQIFAAHAIDLQYGSTVWNSKWDELKNLFDPTLEDVKKYIGSGKVDDDPISNLLGQHPDGVTILSIVECYLEDKIKFEFLEKGACRFLLKVRLSEQNASMVFPAAVLLADSTNIQLATRSKRIVQKIIEKRWTGFSNPKDFLRIIQHKGKSALWYRAFLIH